MSFFSLKTDQNCLGLKKIMLANGADKSAVHSFNQIKEIYSPCLFYVVLLGDFIVLARFETFCRSLHKTESRLVTAFWKELCLAEIRIGLFGLLLFATIH